MVDTSVVDELYDASYRRLVVQLYAICGDLNDAEDAVQEAFVGALAGSAASGRSPTRRPGSAPRRSTTSAAAGGTPPWCAATSRGFPDRRSPSRSGPSTSRS